MSAPARIDSLSIPLSWRGLPFSFCPPFLILFTHAPHRRTIPRERPMFYDSSKKKKKKMLH